MTEFTCSLFYPQGEFPFSLFTIKFPLIYLFEFFDLQRRRKVRLSKLFE